MNNNKSSSLPSSPVDRADLVSRLQKASSSLSAELGELADDPSAVVRCKSSLERIQLRLGLIAKCGELSLLRLTHLQEVFRHYCTHVFRTGRYMTFDRLVHERAHMTIERFFLFLRDFQLTHALIQGISSQILEKQAVVTVFRKVASNARQLSFEEFVQCIDRLAVLFWDNRESYHTRQLEHQQAKEKRRLQLQKRKHKAHPQNSSAQEQEAQPEESPAQPISLQPAAGGSHENDDLVNQLMNNEDIKDPNEQVREMAQKAKQENAQVQQIQKAKQEEIDELKRLSNDEKIESYYQLIDIDSAESYKLKLTNLNLLIFQTIERKAPPPPAALSQSALQAVRAEEDRLQKLKAKLNQKQQKLKDRPLPKPSNEKALKEEQNARRRRQMRKERESAVKQIKKVEEIRQVEVKKGAAPPPPKIEYKDSEVSWQMLQRIGLDHLKLKQFNPTKLYAPEDDDRCFLEQYGARPRIASMQARERQSLTIAADTRQRAEQIERNAKERPRQNSSFTRK